MSPRRDPVRIVQQLALDGSVSVIELHGLGGRERQTTLRGHDAASASRLTGELRSVLGASVVSFRDKVDARPCPKCGKEPSGDLDMTFGFRLVGGRRIRQSWCRVCRGGRPRCRRP